MFKTFLLLFIVFAFLSCNNDSLPLPSSAGGFDQVMIVISDDLKVEMKDSINKYFETPYLVLNQNEASLDVGTATYPKLNSLMKRFRNIIFIGLKDGNQATDKYVKSQVKSLNTVEFRKNMWSQPQIASFYLTENKETLKKTFASFAGSLRDKYLDYELNEYSQLAFASGYNAGLNKQFEENYSFSLRIPKDYILAENDSGFIWLRRDDPEAIVNLMIYVQSDSIASKGIETRNVLGKKYVSSQVKGAYMGTDTLIDPLIERIDINGAQVVESRGLWRMYGDFKGGPFLNIVYRDESNQRNVFIEGFIYAPGEKKKIYLRQLEAILATFSLDTST
ncbi:MAG: DUF4837 family protein [Chitinophagales bacterium]|nr:DUF4837 family protein [Chitinophagales bacterium]